MQWKPPSTLSAAAAEANRARAKAHWASSTTGRIPSPLANTSVPSLLTMALLLPSGPVDGKHLSDRFLAQWSLTAFSALSSVPTWSNGFHVTQPVGQLCSQAQLLLCVSEVGQSLVVDDSVELQPFLDGMASLSSFDKSVHSWLFVSASFCAGKKQMLVAPAGTESASVLCRQQCVSEHGDRS